MRGTRQGGWRNKRVLAVIALRVLLVAVFAAVAYVQAGRPWGASQHVLFFGQALSFLVLRGLGARWALPVAAAAGFAIPPAAGPAFAGAALLAGEVLACAALLGRGWLRTLWSASLGYWLCLGLPLVFALARANPETWGEGAGYAWAGLLVPLVSSQIAAALSVVIGDLTPRALRRRLVLRLRRVTTIEFVHSCCLLIALLPTAVAIEFRSLEQEQAVGALLAPRIEPAFDAALRAVAGSVEPAEALRRLPPAPPNCRFTVESPAAFRSARFYGGALHDHAVASHGLWSGEGLLTLRCAPPAGVARVLAAGMAKRLGLALATVLIGFVLVNQAALRLAGPLRRTFDTLAGPSPRALRSDPRAWLRAPRLLTELVDDAAGQLRRERARTTELLASQEQLIHYAPMIVYTLRLGPGHVESISFVSTSVTRVLGWERAEVLREGWWVGNVHPDDLAKMENDFDDIARAGRYQLEYRIRHRDGSWRHIYDEGIVSRRIADDRLEIIGAMLDITAVAEARERSLADARLTTLGRLAAGVAHELKQPLNVIGMAASNGERMLGMLPLSEQEVGAVGGKFRRIQDQVQRAARIIEQMGLTGRVTGAADAHFSLQQALGAALSLVETELALHQIHVRHEFATEPAPIFGNRQLLEQALMNIFLNARDAIVAARARRGGDAPAPDVIEASLQVDHERRVGRIEIVDPGGGAAPEVLERMFEPFYTTKSVGEGMGLGLSIVYGTISNMQGTIEALNRDGGLCVRLELPLAETAA